MEWIISKNVVLPGYTDYWSITTIDGMELVADNIKTKKDALLIASAPELLEALKETNQFIKSLLNKLPDEAVDLLTNEGEELEKMLKKAIAKAEQL